MNLFVLTLVIVLVTVYFGLLGIFAMEQREPKTKPPKLPKLPKATVVSEL